MKCIIAYLNQYPTRKTRRIYGTRMYILYHILVFQNYWESYIHRESKRQTRGIVSIGQADRIDKVKRTSRKSRNIQEYSKYTTYHCVKTDMNFKYSFEWYDMEYCRMDIIVRWLVIWNCMILDCAVTSHTEGYVWFNMDITNGNIL